MFYEDREDAGHVVLGLILGPDGRAVVLYEFSHGGAPSMSYGARFLMRWTLLHSERERS